MGTPGTDRIREAARAVRAWACYDCGKCTAVCPVTRSGGSLSPRRRVLEFTGAGAEPRPDDEGLWACLTCGLCSRRCPAEVDYPLLVRHLREAAWDAGIEPDCPHGGALQSLMRIMARGRDLQPERLDWLDETLKTEAEQGEVFYWTGCTMYYDALFPHLQMKTLDGTRAAVGLMNRIGVDPVVSAEERCCGHDLLWNGDRADFERLARHNVALLESSGARTLVTSCAECLRTWRLDYAPFFKGPPPEMLHISEWLTGRIENGGKPEKGPQRVTYQDPCRLGRHLGVYEAPRELLAALPGIEVVEMPRHGSAAICCAGGTWSHCDRYAKSIQVERLKEARATGAQVLVTACPKCRIHLQCAMQNPDQHDAIGIEVRDIAEVVIEALT